MCVSAVVACVVTGECLRGPVTTCVRAVDTTLGAASVYKVVNYLTRLETRIAEFSVAASQWVRETQRRNESERTHDLLQLK